MTGGPIEKYFPVTESSAPIRIEHLLSHTSGLQNINDVPGFEHDSQRQVGVDELLEHILRQPCTFASGTGVSREMTKMTKMD